MSVHINRFVDRLRALEARNVKEFSCSIQDARDLHRDITKLLNALTATQTPPEPKDEDTTVVMRGGAF